MHISAQEKKALHHRIHVEGDLSWTEYMQKHRDKTLFRLRDKLIRFIARVVSEKDTDQENSDTDESETLSPLVVSESESHDASDVCLYRSPHTHLFPEYKALLPKNKDKPFILDFGSKNLTSNADLTLMNFDARRHVENKVLQRLESLIGSYLPHPITFETLKKNFDIQLFMNAFLFFIPEHTFLFYVSGMPATSRTQKMQLRYAKRSLVSAHHDFHTLFRVRKEALRVCRVYRLLQTTSMIMMMIDDAYVSNGAWLHVLLEIQNGLRLNLAPIEYLQSAYENIYMMLKHLADRNPSHDKHHAMNKYAFRLVHALRGICIGTNANSRIYIHATAIVNLLHRVSRYAPDIYPNVKFSIGHLSVENSVPNTRYRSSLRRILTSSHNKHAFHVPGRTWETNDDRVMMNTILYIQAYLGEIERLIMS